MASKTTQTQLDQEISNAAFVCDFVKVRALLAAGASIEARDEDGRTPLFSAVLGGSIGLVGLLIEHGCDINARDNDGFTPLHYAAQEYLPEIARLLVAKGADVNARDEDGNTVLWRAVFSSAGRDEIVRTLLDGGAKPEIANNAGEDANALAERLGLDVLKSGGEKPN